MYSADAVEELLTCAICLERLTQPKMLPCQHTYCLSCLLSLGANPPGCIMCPGCRKQHRIPKSGMKAFAENLVINNLLSLPLNMERLHVSPKCHGCHGKVSREGELCEHCVKDPKIPVIEKINCNVAMMKSLLTDPKVISDLNDNKTVLTNLAENLLSEQERMNAEFAQFTKALNEKNESMNVVFQTAIRMQQLVANSVGDKNELEAFYKEIVDEVSSTPDLDQLRLLDLYCEKYLSWFRIICGMVAQEEEFRFQWKMPEQKFASLDNDGSEFDGIQKLLGTMGAIYHGDCVVDETPEQATEESAWHEVKCNGIERRVSQNGTAPAGVGEDEQGAVGGVAVAPSVVEDRKPSGANGAIPRKPQPMPQYEPAGANLQPVKYYEKSYTRPKLITCRNKHGGLNWPSGLTYAAQSDKLSVADTDNNRILIMNSDGSHACTYHDFVRRQPRADLYMQLNTPIGLARCPALGLYLVANSGDSQIICRTVYGEPKYAIGSHGKGKDKFWSIKGITCHKNCVLAVDKVNRRVSIFQLQDDCAVFVRNFGQKHFEAPQYIAVGPNDHIYVTDDKRSDVSEFDWNGKLLRTFGGDDQSMGASGIFVDRQGFTCVARPDGNCLQVYDPDGNLFWRIDQGLSTPQDLELLPDGRIVVCDAGKNRLVVI